MSARKVFASVSLLMCLSGSVSAMDFRSGYSSIRSNVHKVGWDQKSLEAQTQGAVYLRAQIKKLEQQNEQLRNSLSQMRAKASQATSVARDPRLQALIEENKRISNQLLVSKERNDARQTGISADVYMQKLYALEAENKKTQEQLAHALTQSGGASTFLKQENMRLKSSLSALASSGTGDQGKITNLEKEIRSLKGQNTALLSSSQSGETSKATMGKIIALQSTVQELQGENRKLAQTLASSSDKLLGLHERADLARSEKDVNTRSVETLRSTLVQAQKENASLNQTIQKLKTAKSKPSVVANNSGIQSLKKQNQSLRETIRAQNGVLVSADNATKTAERLLMENTMLKRQVELAGKAGLSNGKSAKELFARNTKLESEIKQRNDYIQQLEGLKDTVKQLRLENDKYVMGKATSNSVKQRFTALKVEQQNLDGLLKKERKTATQYRMKIREYQEEIAGIRNGQSKEMASKISDYKSKMLLLEKGQGIQNKEITALKLKIQELKAQNKLSSEKASALKKNAIIARAHEVKEQDEKVVTLVDTTYPPVEQIAPLLDHDGEHRYNKENMLDDNNATPVSETLLSQSLKPLSNQ